MIQKEKNELLVNYEIRIFIRKMETNIAALNFISLTHLINWLELFNGIT